MIKKDMEVLLPHAIPCYPCPSENGWLFYFILRQIAISFDYSCIYISKVSMIQLLMFNSDSICAPGATDY